MHIQVVTCKSNCCKCGRFIGADGYPDIFPDDYSGGYDAGYALCGPCGRKAGKPDKRKGSRRQENKDES